MAHLFEIQKLTFGSPIRTLGDVRPVSVDPSMGPASSNFLLMEGPPIRIKFSGYVDNALSAADPDAPYTGPTFECSLYMGRPFVTRSVKLP